MSITIKESVEFETHTMTVLKLKNAVTKGNDDFNALFSTVAGVLQRINQKDEWIKDNFKRSKEFMNCVITGAGALDNIMKAGGISSHYKQILEDRKEAPIEVTATDVGEVKSLLDSMNITKNQVLLK